MAPAKKRVWDKFKELSVDGVKKGKCKACDSLVVNNPARLEKHLDKCSTKKDEGGEDILQSDAPGPSKVMKQTTLTLQISKAKHHELDLGLFSRRILVENVPDYYSG